MRHTYLCPLRWADLDELGHANNVVYVDYLQEARVDLLRSLRQGMPTGEAGEGIVVVRHELSYLSPIYLRDEPLRIDCWVTQVRAASFTMAYELIQEDDDGPRVCARATTVLAPYVFGTERPRRLDPVERAELERLTEEPYGPPAPRAPALDIDGATHYAVQVRFSDVDVYRHVNNVKYIEYLQEARVGLSRLMWRSPEVAAEEHVDIVVAQAEVDYRVPMILRQAPYDLWSRVVEVGSRSMTIDSEIHDDGELCARGRVTLVFFDRATQRSVEPPTWLRERLEASAVS